MKRDNGFGLIVAVFVILILSLLMLFSASMFSTDIEIALDSLRSTQALYLCEGALNYCIKHELIDDSDWSDNTDIINKPLGRGTFSIYYDPNKTTATQTTIRVLATVDDITRQTIRSFEQGWPKRYEDFPYSLYTSSYLDILKSPAISIETPYEVNNPNTQDINCDFGYYASIADTTKSADWTLDRFSNQTITGIIYVNGMMVLKKCDNLTINGSIVATGDILIRGCKGLSIYPSGNYPALASGGVIRVEKEGATKSEFIDIQGMVFSQVDVYIFEVLTFSMTGVLYAGQYVDVIKTSDFRSDGSIIAISSIKFDDCKGTGPDINWGTRVLDEPPGFSWSGAITKGTWEEPY